jgi:transcriptional regulator with XRE-family HTH domain
MLLPVPNRIRTLREQCAAVYPAAFSATAVAHRLGVTDKTLRSWEQGIRRPTARHARALARDLGVTVQDLGLDEVAPTRQVEEADA